MKKQLFTLVMMVALVMTTGSLMAQSTKSAPYVGSTYTYSVSGVTGSAYGIYVTANTVTDGSTASANQVANTVAIVSSNTGNAGYVNQAISANINWLSPGTYRIWAVVENAEGCTNYIYKDITVISQNVEYRVIALGQSSGNLDFTHFGSTILTGECFQKTGATYENSSAASGTSVVYFKVVRTAPANDAWSFTATFSGDANINSIAWGTTASPAIPTTSGSTINVTTTNNEAYFAVTIADATSDKSVILTASSYDESSTTISQTVINDDSAEIRIEGLPSIGTFSGL